MSIFTRSAFYYGHKVTTTNNSIPFNEGSSELIATLNIGDYSLTNYAIEVARAMNVVGGQIYETTVDRATRKITISAPGNFELMFATGSTVGISAASLMGFDSVDTGLDLSHQGENGSGSSYRPQFLLQDYVDFEDNVEASAANVNVSASGVTEVVKFGDNEIMRCNIRYITNNHQGYNSPIENNQNGKSDYKAFISFITGKGDIEFIPDRDNASVFTTCFLDSTPESKDGVNYRIKELYSQNLVGYFESGQLEFRKKV